jgi:hypothetical protein
MDMEFTAVVVLTIVRIVIPVVVLFALGSLVARRAMPQSA